MMRVDVLTIFPEVFEAYLATSITGRAVRRRKLAARVHDLRDYTTDRHRVTDDYPFGGGAGMVMKAEPIFRAVEKLRRKDSCVILTSPQGKTWVQERAVTMARRKHLIVICGHYRGVDQRVLDELVDEEVSIGDYVLSGGELAALVIVDSLARLQPGAVSDADSVAGDSFSDGLLDYPHYTRPRTFHGLGVPEVLLTGDHQRIADWRGRMKRRITAMKRSDLLVRKSEVGGGKSEPEDNQ